MRSMTGFAAASGEEGGGHWRWEIKSVNARGLDLRLRLPGGLDRLEAACRAQAQKRLSRGSVSAQLQIKTQAGVGAPTLDEAALGARIAALAQARKALENAGVALAPVSGESLLQAPGVMIERDMAAATNAPHWRKTVLSGFDEALDGLIRERDAEGARLHGAISEQVSQIESLTRDASEGAGNAVRMLRDRLRARIASLTADGAGLSPERLEVETAALATKADIQEELDRLNSHVEAARALMREDAPIGRRLDFLTQEFNREANTLCSKSASEALTRIGLALKTVIDQLREQAANVE